MPATQDACRQAWQAWRSRECTRTQGRVPPRNAACCARQCPLVHALRTGIPGQFGRRRPTARVRAGRHDVHDLSRRRFCR
eukprot:6855768-Alexandrium_andersonii.AAC.1